MKNKPRLLAYYSHKNMIVKHTITGDTERIICRVKGKSVFISLNIGEAKTLSRTILDRINHLRMPGGCLKIENNMEIHRNRFNKLVLSKDDPRPALGKYFISLTDEEVIDLCGFVDKNLKIRAKCPN